MDRLKPHPAIAGECDLEVNKDFRLSLFMEEGFYRDAASGYEMPPHWQNFIIKMMELFFGRGEFNDQKLLQTVRILAAGKGVKWEFLFRIYGAETGGLCGYREVANTYRVDPDLESDQVYNLIRFKDEFLEG